MPISRPQRVVAIARPGTLFKRPTVPRVVPEAFRQDDSYLRQIRDCPCLKCGMDPCGLAAHLRMNSGAFNKRQAMARRPSSKWTTPLCAACHTEDPDSQHKVGEAAFWMVLGINPFLLCERLYAKAGDLVAMRAVVFSAIADRRSKPLVLP